jgi:hypothetical protein
VVGGERRVRLPSAPRLVELFRFAIGAIVFWIVIQAYSASVGRLVVAKWPIADVLAAFGTRALLWAFLTPVFVAVVERITAFTGPRWLRVVSLGACVPALAIAEAFLESAVRHGYDLRARAFSEWVRRLTIQPNLLMSTLAILMVHVLIARFQSAERERRRLELERALAEMQAEKLRDRFRPGDLQDILGAIGEAVEHDVARAQALLRDLAELLRLAMQLDGRTVVRLHDELDLADRYAALRSPATPLRIQADDDAMEALVPPRSVQAFLDNVFARAAAEINLDASMNGDLHLRASSISAAGTAFVSELRIPLGGPMSR